MGCTFAEDCPEIDIPFFLANKSWERKKGRIETKVFLADFILCSSHFTSWTDWELQCKVIQDFLAWENISNSGRQPIFHRISSFFAHFHNPLKMSMVLHLKKVAKNLNKFPPNLFFRVKPAILQCRKIPRKNTRFEYRIKTNFQRFSFLRLLVRPNLIGLARPNLSLKIRQYIHFK